MDRKIILFTIFIIIIVGVGFLVYKFLQKSGEKNLPKTSPQKELAYPKSHELFESCFNIYSSESEENIINSTKELPKEMADEVLKIWREEYLPISENEIAEAIGYIKEEKEFLGEKISNVQDLEETLNRGFIEKGGEELFSGIFGWGGVGFLCRDNLMDKNLRPEVYKEICQKNSSCCQLPETKDTESVREFAKKISDCIEPNFEIEDIKETDYGYSIKDGWAHVEAVPFSYYLTKNGCLVNCYFPFTALSGIKSEIWEKIETILENAAKESAKKSWEEKTEGKILKLEDCLNSSGFEKEVCIRNIAIRNKNKELCNYIEEKPWRRSCELDVKILTSTNLSPCKEFLTLELKPYEADSLNGKDWEKKEECVRDIAIENSDINLCSLLYDGYSSLQYKCFYEIIFKGEISDFNSCPKMPTQDMKEVCYATVSVNKNDLEMCKNYGGQFYSLYCYKGIAVKRKDSNICSMIPENAWVRQDCFSDINQ